MKKNLKSILIAFVIAVPLSLYAIGQQKLNAEAHKDDFRPVAEVRVIELQMVVQEEVQDIAPKEVVEEVPAVVQQNEPEIISLGEFKLTAYCSCEKCCDSWALNRPVDEEGNEIVIGASGEILEEGVSIAVDTNVIPYGTTVLINGQEYIAHDCGGAIKQNRIDVYFNDHQTALEFGEQYAEVFLVKEGEIDG